MSLAITPRVTKETVSQIRHPWMLQTHETDEKVSITHFRIFFLKGWLIHPTDCEVTQEWANCYVNWHIVLAGTHEGNDYIYHHISYADVEIFPPVIV